MRNVYSSCRFDFMTDILAINEWLEKNKDIEQLDTELMALGCHGHINFIQSGIDCIFNQKQSFFRALIFTIL